MDHVRLLDAVTRAAFAVIPPDNTTGRVAAARGIVVAFEAEGANISAAADSMSECDPLVRDAYREHRSSCLAGLKRHLGVVTLCSDGVPRRLIKLQEEILFFETQTPASVMTTHGQRVTVAPLFLNGDIDSTSA